MKTRVCIASEFGVCGVISLSSRRSRVMRTCCFSPSMTHDPLLISQSRYALALMTKSIPFCGRAWEESFVAEKQVQHGATRAAPRQMDWFMKGTSIGLHVCLKGCSCFDRGGLMCKCFLLMRNWLRYYF